MSSYKIAGRSLTAVGLIIAFAIVLFGGAWALMIVLGMLASYTGLTGLAIGFWPSLVVRFLLRMAFSNGSLETS